MVWFVLVSMAKYLVVVVSLPLWCWRCRRAPLQERAIVGQFAAQGLPAAVIRLQAAVGARPSFIVSHRFHCYRKAAGGGLAHILLSCLPLLLLVAIVCFFWQMLIAKHANVSALC